MNGAAKIVQYTTCMTVYDTWSGLLDGLWVSVLRKAVRPLGTLRKAARSGGKCSGSVGRVDDTEPSSSTEV